MPPLPLIPGSGEINWGAMNATDYGAPDPYAAYDEYRRRQQLIEDRDFDLRKRQIDQQKEQIAITRGQAAANKWYQEQMVQLAKDKFEQDKFQFEVGATGYINGKPTMAREQFQDSSLQGWSDKAIQLAMQPKDWVAYKKLTAGVANNIGSIPGLNWASGGQVGNTAFAGNPETNSLSNVLGNMGVNVGQGGSGGAGVAQSGSWASSGAQLADSIANGNPNLNSQEQQIYKTADEFSRNPQGAAPGWWDSLDPLTKSLIQGASQSQGHDFSTVLSRMKRSQWGGGGSAQAA